MATSDEWSELANRFRSLPAKDLCAFWSQEIGVNKPIYWTISGAGYDAKAQSLRRQFDALARRAGRALNPPSKSDLAVVWLNAVKKVAPEGIGDSGHITIGGVKVPRNSGTIEGICEQSAGYCSAIEALAVQAEHRSHGKRRRKGVATKKRSIRQHSSSFSTPTRNDLLLAYKREGKQAGIKITDPMVAKAASPSWNDRTPVARWKSNDKRCTVADDHKIRKVLRDKPHLQKK
jgi:hypothetical protein